MTDAAAACKEPHLKKHGGQKAQSPGSGRNVVESGEPAGAQGPAQEASQSARAAGSLEDVLTQTEPSAHPCDHDHGPYSAVESLRAARAMEVFGNSSVELDMPGKVTLAINYFDLLDAVDQFAIKHSRLPKHSGPRWFPGESALGCVFQDLKESVADGSVKDSFSDHLPIQQRDDIIEKINLRLAELTGKHRPPPFGYPQIHEMKCVKGCASCQGSQMHAILIWQMSTWDGKDTRSFPFASGGHSEEEHADHEIIQEIQDFVKKHWGLPQLTGNQDIPLAEGESCLGNKWSKVQAVLRQGGYANYGATKSAVLELERWCMPAVMIGSVRAVLPRGGQFSVQFGKAPHAAKLVCACWETFEAVISDRKCVSEAIDWLPPGSTPAEKKKAAETALQRMEREAAATEGNQNVRAVLQKA